MSPRALLRILGALTGGGLALAAVPSLAQADTADCTFDTAKRRATIVTDAPAWSSTTIKRALAPDIGRFVVGYQLAGGSLLRCPNVATMTGTDSIAIKSTHPSTYDHVIVDQSAGTFIPGATAEADDDEIEIFALTGTGGDRLDMIGTPYKDSVVIGGTWPTQIGLDADGDPDLTVSDPNRIVVEGRGGGDFLTGRGGTEAGGALPTNAIVELHGGEGDDGLLDTTTHGGDVLHGDAGNDHLFAGDDQLPDTVDGGSAYDSGTVDPTDTLVSMEQPFVLVRPFAPLR